jgi:hypothetical protein
MEDYECLNGILGLNRDIFLRLIHKVSCAETVKHVFFLQNKILMNLFSWWESVVRQNSGHYIFRFFWIFPDVWDSLIHSSSLLFMFCLFLQVIPHIKKHNENLEILGKKFTRGRWLMFERFRFLFISSCLFLIKENSSTVGVDMGMGIGGDSQNAPCSSRSEQTRRGMKVFNHFLWLYFVFRFFLFI